MGQKRYIWHIWQDGDLNSQIDSSMMSITSKMPAQKVDLKFDWCANVCNAF